jgi:hypothetical protein
VREKLNSDPRYQFGLVALLVIAAGYMLLGGGLGGGGEESEEAAPTEATVAVAGTNVTGTATGATPGEAVEGAVASAIESATGEAAAASVTGSIPAPPPPAPVTKAYDAGKTVVLLVVRSGGIDDRLVASSAEQVAGESDVALFVVPVKQIARYAAITLGVDVTQVPALVVMRPKHLSDGTPQASVIYGFQATQSVDQAIRDASYKGPEATYHPN